MSSALRILETAKNIIDMKALGDDAFIEPVLTLIALQMMMESDYSMLDNEYEKAQQQGWFFCIVQTGNNISGGAQTPEVAAGYDVDVRSALQAPVNPNNMRLAAHIDSEIFVCDVPFMSAERIADLREKVKMGMA